VYVDVLLLEDAIVALGLSHSGGAVIEKELQPAVDQSYYSPNIRDPPFGRIRNIPIDPGELQVGSTAPSPKCLLLILHKVVKRGQRFLRACCFQPRQISLRGSEEMLLHYKTVHNEQHTANSRAQQTGA
jgi:hypothetical protein